MFSNLKPKKYTPFDRSAGRGKPTSIFGKLYIEAMEKEIVTHHGRGPEYRPSSFPSCSILTYMRLSVGAHEQHFKGRMAASGGYFTSVGTAAHENIQYYIGELGQVWGDWKCRNPRCQARHDAQDLFNEQGECWRKGKLTRKNTTKNRCPLCDHAMEYVEKEINYKGLKGHIDCIIKLKGGGWWVGDYKTSTKYQITNAKTLLPHKAHLKQIPTYCYVLRKKYKMDVRGFSVLYFSRDNPFLFHEYSELWSSQWTKRVKEIIADEKRKFRAGVASFVQRDPSHAIKAKPCKCKRDYEEEIAYYDECPMLGVCFTKKLPKILDAHKATFTYTDKDIKRASARIAVEILE